MDQAKPPPIHLPRGPYRVFATHPFGDIWEDSISEFAVAAEDTPVTVNMQLAAQPTHGYGDIVVPTKTIRLEIKTKDGSPARQADVFLRDNSDHLYSENSARTDDAGKVSLELIRGEMIATIYTDGKIFSRKIRGSQTISLPF